MNKLPFYRHCAVVLFNGTKEISKEEFQKVLIKFLYHENILTKSIKVEECAVEPID